MNDEAKPVWPKLSKPARRRAAMTCDHAEIERAHGIKSEGE